MSRQGQRAGHDEQSYWSPTWQNEPSDGMVSVKCAMRKRGKGGFVRLRLVVW
jgi:hypothetical protein